MLYINRITSDPQQSITLTGIPGASINMRLRFMPRIQQWIVGLTYNTFEVEGLAIVTSLNLLRQWKNIIPFGISCVRVDGLDPYTINDFAYQQSNLYLLNAADIAAIEKGYFT